MKSTWLKDNFLFLLSLIVVVGAFSFDFMLLFKEVPNDNKTLLNVITGSLNTGALGVVLNYFFSSSTGSADKSETIKTMVTALTPNADGTIVKPK